MIHLFIGQDAPTKASKFEKIKKTFLLPSLEQFNLDILYGKEITLQQLQEKLRCLPVQASKRMVVIRQAEELQEDSREFLRAYVKKPFSHVIVVIDADRVGFKDDFFSEISRNASVSRFKDEPRPDTFFLSRQIEYNKPQGALNVLRQLLEKGEKPERILGGLRYSWEKNSYSPAEKRRRLALLLQCDLDIKTGRLNPSFALEKLVLCLCHFGKQFR